MVNLDIKDQNQLIFLLKDVPELSTERSRLQILELSGLKKLAPMIDMSGNSFIAISEIVNYLSKYGCLNNNGSESLGMLLKTIKGFVGLEKQNILEELLIRYKMLSIPECPIIEHWKGQETTEGILEKIIGENTLHPIAFLQRGLEVARSVAFVEGQGTGFLVSEDLFLTNNHVLPSSISLPNYTFCFNYENDFLGQAQPSEKYYAKSNGCFYTNEKLDYTLVQLDGKPGKKWGWLSLRGISIKIKDRVNIIQHPNGRPKEISFQNNFVEYLGGNVLQYTTATQEGSSGSPVLNNSWEVVALHHAGGTIPEPTTQQYYFRNEGILIEKILADLPSEIEELLNLDKSSN
jgi:V8-like Glu-specific endopeptidase